MSDIAALLESGIEISDPKIWQKLAIVIAQRFEELSAHQSPFSGFKSLALAADQHIKAKVLQTKGAGGATKGLEELRRRVSEALSAPELNSDDEQED